METTIRKLRNIFTKYDKDYFVLANLNHNAIFIFEKDVQAVWEILDEELSVEELLRRLQGKGYSVIAEDFYDLVEVMSKAGLIFNDQVSEDLEYISQNNSYESYIERCSSNNLPSILHIELTNGCNLKCIHCYHDEAIQSLNLDDIEHLFQNSENSSFVRVTLTGGEVFCYPHWREVVTMARQHGYIVSILSNITLLTERDIEFLKQSNISFIRTSLYGVNEKTHDLICTVDGSFNKTFNNILALKEAGVSVSVACTIMRQNVNEMLELKNLMDSIGVSISFYYKIIPSRMDTKDVKSLLITAKDFQYLLKHGMLNKSSKSKCKPGTYRIAISNSGEIYSCDLLRVSLGNIKNDNIMDVLNGKKIKEIQQMAESYKPLDCQTCDHEQYCTPCPGLVWSNTTYSNTHHPVQCLYCRMECDSL